VVRVGQRVRVVRVLAVILQSVFQSQVA
jgi:hypothetical protein